MVAASAFVLGVIIALGGCSAFAPAPVPTTAPSSTSTVVDTSKYIGGVIDPADTVWTGKDSGGDTTVMTLHADGTLAVTYGDNSYDYAGDTWYVSEGVLHAEIFLDATNGLAEVESIDLPATIVKLQMQEVAYQSALQATARMIQPSLVDFLR